MYITFSLLFLVFAVDAYSVLTLVTIGAGPNPRIQRGLKKVNIRGMARVRKAIGIWGVRPGTGGGRTSRSRG